MGEFGHQSGIDKYITIKDCTKEELKTILNDWLVMYVNKLKSKLIFEIAIINPNMLVLKVDESIDGTEFFFMVNYFAYPINFNKKFEVEGYTTATKHKKLLNKNIYVFNNEQDNECDNVWITTEDNETYKFDFGGKLKRIDIGNKHKALNIDNLSISYEQISFNKKELLEEAKRKEKERSKRSVGKRFKIISTILFVLIPSAILINNYFPYSRDGELKSFCAIIVVVWFILDYKIFDSAKRTLICVLLASLIIAIEINAQTVSITTFATNPLSAIVVMWSTNKLLGDKLDDIYDDRRKGTLFMLRSIIITFLISLFVLNPILKFFK